MLQLIKNWFLRSSLFVAVFLSVSIAFISLMDASSLPTHSFNISDKLLHALAYFVLIWSWMLVFRNKQFGMYKLLVFISLLLFGIILEFLQGGMMFHRTADWKDVIANFTGLLLGLLTFNQMYKIIFKENS